MQTITTLGLDADDTLWHNEQVFRLTQARFETLLADHTDTTHLHTRLLEAEHRNLGQYGFGVKGFVLSMIETALEVTDNAVPGAVIAELIAAGQDMLSHPIEVFDGVPETLEQLAGHYKLVLITKGDLLDQERKLAQSHLGDFFSAVEIVSDKTASVYQRIFAQHGTGAKQGAMVGNSVRSDVMPALSAGAWGVHIPHDLTWEYERAKLPQDMPRLRQLQTFSDLPDLLMTLTERHPNPLRDPRRARPSSHAGNTPSETCSARFPK